MKYTTLFALFVLPLLVSCILPMEYSLDFDCETFEAQRALWREQDCQDYSFYLRYSGYENGSWNVTVIIKDGDLQKYNYDSKKTGSGYVYADMNQWIDIDLKPWVDSIDTIFAEIERLADREAKGKVIIAVDYDAEYHYPRRLHYAFYGPQTFPPPDPGGGSDHSYNVSIQDFVLDSELE